MASAGGASGAGAESDDVMQQLHKLEGMLGHMNGRQDQGIVLLGRVDDTTQKMRKTQKKQIKSAEQKDEDLRRARLKKTLHEACATQAQFDHSLITCVISLITVRSQPDHMCDQPNHSSIPA